MKKYLISIILFSFLFFGCFDGCRYIRALQHIDKQEFDKALKLLNKTSPDTEDQKQFLKKEIKRYKKDKELYLNDKNAYFYKIIQDDLKEGYDILAKSSFEKMDKDSLYYERAETLLREYESPIDKQ